MGLAASQFLVLSLTSRMSDLELKAQTISNSKIRLANKSENAATVYSNSLNKTKLQVYSGMLSGGEANYINATAHNLTTYDAISDTDKQRFLKDTKGMVIVSKKMADRYTASGPNLENFLNSLGYTRYKNSADIRQRGLVGIAEKEIKTNIDSILTTIAPAIVDREDAIAKRALSKEAKTVSDTISEKYSTAQTYNTNIVNINSNKIATEKKEDRYNHSTDVTYATKKTRDAADTMKTNAEDSYTNASKAKDLLDDLKNNYAQQLNYRTTPPDVSTDLTNASSAKDSAVTSAENADVIWTNMETAKTDILTDYSNSVTSVKDATDKACTATQDGLAQTKLSDWQGSTNEPGYTQLSADDTSAKTNKTSVNNKDIYPDTPASLAKAVTKMNDMLAVAKSSYTIANNTATYFSNDSTVNQKFNEAATAINTDSDNISTNYNDAKGILDNRPTHQHNLLNSYKNTVDYADNTATKANGVTSAVEAYAKGFYDSVNTDYNTKNDAATAAETTADKSNTVAINAIADQMGTIKTDLKEIDVYYDNATLTKWINQGAMTDVMDVFNYVSDIKQGLRTDESVVLSDKSYNPDNKYDPYAVKYYTNVFNEIKENGCNPQSDENMKSSGWLQAQLASGNLFLAEFNSKGGNDGLGDFENISYTSGDSSLKSNMDNTDMAKAEVQYKKSIAAIQSKEKRFDLELSRIDTEHSAIKNELDSVKKVIDKNIERAFKVNA